MELKVKISSESNSIDYANAHEFVLDRQMGRAVKWYFTLNFTDQALNNGVKSIVDLILSGRCDIQGFIDGEEVSPKMQITGVKQGGENTAQRLLTIEGTYTKTEKKIKQFDPLTDPFVPRRRILHAKNLYELVKQFGHIVKIPDSIQYDLSGIIFPDGDKAVLIQDGVSDWEFLSGLLYRFSVLNQFQNPLILSGSAAEDHPLWSIIWGSEQTYIDKGQVEDRKVIMDYTNDKGVHFSFDTLYYAALGPDASLSNLPIVNYRYPQRHFTIDRWMDWNKKDVPIFLEEDEQQRMVYRIIDHFGESGAEDTVYWKSQLYILPSPGKLLPRRMSNVLSPWMGIGEVVENSPKSPWLKIKLPGFQDNEKNDNHLNVRLTTPYSGEGGENGLHLLPEKGTVVSLNWSGAWDESIILQGNVRMADMEIDHPSFKLEKPTAWHMDKVDWQMKETTINSEDLSWNSGNVIWNAKNANWNANDFTVNTDGNHIVKAGGDSVVEATGKANLDGMAVNVKAKTSVAINGTTDVKLNC